MQKLNKVFELVIVSIFVSFLINSSLFSFTPSTSSSKPAEVPNQDARTVTDLEKKVITIFQENCTSAGCHSGTYPQQGLKLTEDAYFKTTVNQPSIQKPKLMRIKPGSPDSSYLVMKILGTEEVTGLRMPFGRDPLTQEQIATIVEWIKSLEGEKVQTGGEVKVAALPFNGWKAVNLPTTRMVEKGRWLFLIGHRFFPQVNDGYDAFYGLDGSASIFLNLGYAFADNFYVNLGRSNLGDNVELYARYGIKQQFSNEKLPFSMAVQTAVNWLTEKRPGQDRLRSDAFKYSAQIMFAHEPREGMGLLFVPGILINPDSETESEDPLVTLGLGGRIHVYKSISVVGEWSPIVAGYILTRSFGDYNRFDAWSAGIEIAVGGHVFQIVTTNSIGLTTDQYMRGGDLDIRDGDMRLGFNIFRILEF